MSKQEETPLSKLLFYQKGKEVKTHVRTLLTLRNTSAAQTVRFISMLEQKRREFQVETGEPQ